jgi:hypothetical protein
VKRYSRPAERGLGPNGGAWNVKQASAWSGIGENELRNRINAGLIPCAYLIGRRRRIVIARQGFIDWFNRGGGSAA